MSQAPGAERHQMILEIPSRLEFLVVVDKVADGITEYMAFEDVDRDAVAISVVEACTNAIQHGHQLAPDKVVRVRFEVGEDVLRISVTDQGPGFIPPSEEETSPPDLLATRGRGIFIMRAMMDEVDFDCRQGTTVHLIKRRDRGKEEGETLAP